MQTIRDQKFRAMIVCVNYSDYLALTYDHNRKHFSEVCVITSPDDIDTQTFCDAYTIPRLVTDAFYLNGASFDKASAMNEGLKYFGIDGWMMMLDADIALPRTLRFRELNPSCLYVPFRRMLTPYTRMDVPDQTIWNGYPRRDTQHFVGYCQIFHGKSPQLDQRPKDEIFEANNNAGKYDKRFESLWPVEQRIRPLFEVLHIGPPAVNWDGRNA